MPRRPAPKSTLIAWLRSGRRPTLPNAGQSYESALQRHEHAAIRAARRVTDTDAQPVAPVVVTVEPALPGMSFWPKAQQVTLGATGYHFVALPEAVSVAVDAAAPATLTLQDILGGKIQVQVPADTVTAATTFHLAAVPPPYQQDEVLISTAFAVEFSPETELAQPLPVMITYREAGIRLVRPDTALILRRWNGTARVDVADSCTKNPIIHNADQHTVATSICMPGQYALFGSTYRMYLPLTGE